MNWDISEVEWNFPPKVCAMGDSMIGGNSVAPVLLCTLSMILMDAHCMCQAQNTCCGQGTHPMWICMPHWFPGWLAQSKFRASKHVMTPSPALKTKMGWLLNGGMG